MTDIGFIRQTLVDPPVEGGGGAPELTLVAVGQSTGSPPGPTIETSEDALVWTLQSSPFTTATIGLAYGGGLWVAGCAFIGGSGERIATSPDGITWTARSSVLDDGGCINTFYNGSTSTWFAFGANSSFQGKIAKSVDGITWSTVSATFEYGLADMDYDGTTLVLVGGFGSGGHIRTSTDNGDNWTSQTHPFDGGVGTVVWNGSIWVAGGYDSTPHCIMTSPDAITWTARSSPFDLPSDFGDSYVAGIDWNGTIFVAVGRGGSREKNVATSPDGINWTYRPSPLDDNGDGTDVRWSNALGLWVAGSGGTLATSPNGINWTERTDQLLYIQRIVAKS